MEILGTRKILQIRRVNVKKGILWIVVILWVMAGVQFLMGINKKDESQIIEAFHITNSLESISRVEIGRAHV